MSLRGPGQPNDQGNITRIRVAIDGLGFAKKIGYATDRDGVDWKESCYRLFFSEDCFNWDEEKWADEDILNFR